ncbi:unnamed protein product [Sphagnum balticum]
MNTPATSRYGSQSQHNRSTVFGSANPSATDGSQRQLVATFTHIFGEKTQQQQNDTETSMMLDATNHTNNTTTSDAGAESAASLSRPGSAASTSSLPTLAGDTLSSSSPLYYLLWMSMAEIYNENVYDLLVPQSTAGGKAAAATARPRLVISEDKKDNTYIKGLRWVFVTSADDILRLVHLARKNMQIAATKLNASSSRSERSSRTGAQRQTETCAINNSLTFLKRCVHAIYHNQTHPNDAPHLVPYRDSKLTRVFQSFFTGTGRVRMLATVAPDASESDETAHVLKFAAIVQRLETRAARADVPTSSLPPLSACLDALPPRFSEVGVVFCVQYAIIR